MAAALPTWSSLTARFYSHRKLSFGDVHCAAICEQSSVLTETLVTSCCCGRCEKYRLNKPCNCSDYIYIYIILHEIRKRKANWIGHILHRNCLLQRVTEGKIQGGIEVTGRQGRRRRKLLDYLKKRRGYFHLKEEALDRAMWRARFGRGFGPVVRQTAKWMNELLSWQDHGNGWKKILQLTPYSFVQWYISCDLKMA